MEEITLTEEDLLAEGRNESQCETEEKSVAELKIDSEVVEEIHPDNIEQPMVNGNSAEGLEIETVDNVENETNCTDNAEENLMDSLLKKLEVLEAHNVENVNEIDNQKKVIEMLRREVTKKDEELHAMEKELQSTKSSLETRYKLLNDETSKRINDLKKAFDQANKDKESMVIKYAMGEKDILIAKRGRDEYEKRLKEALKDNDSFQYKIKTLGTDRTRLQGLCEARGQETNQAKKEVEKLKDELKLSEAKLTLANDKLKVEAESHQNTKESLDRTFKELLEVQGSIDDIKKEYSDLISKAKMEEESKRKKEMIQEKEQSVKLMIDSAAAAELETLKTKYKEAIDENNHLSVKVQNNEKDLLTYESNLSELKETLAKQKSEIVDLYSKCAELESLKLQLASETEKVVSRDAEVTRLRTEATDLLSDMAACRRKEGELLQFTQKLTDKNVTLQSEFGCVESRAADLEEKHSKIVTSYQETENRLSEVVRQLDIERAKRKEETELLAKKLAEKVKALETASQSVVDANNEVDVVRRQNQARVRELSKELSSVKKRLEVAERDSGQEREGSPGQLSVSSRCSSSSSISRDCDVSRDQNSDQHMVMMVTRTSDNGVHQELSPTMTLAPADTQQLLVEKIVKLQKNCARRQEKLDILEEHVSQLMNEIKKKNRIIQSYVMNIEPGALITEESDIHKAKVATSQGIMSSLYNSKVADSGMTLELSLEINKKLQAVLEDTLLKNITLKDNINTLGQEISKISINKSQKIS